MTEARVEPVAIVGMSCRVAGAETPTELWRLATAGQRRVVPVPPGRWPGLDRRLAPTPYAALLEHIDHFDARFFGITSRMAAWLDPQHRMLLELAQHAVEQAGYLPENLHGAPIAVFAGAFMSDYDQVMNLAGRSDGAALPGTLMAFLANRVSYQFGWTGPSLVVDSACSSGLAALGLAVRGIQAGEYPMALVGASNIINAGFYANNAYRGGALSPSGGSVPFSAARDGYIRGEGGACVLLKPLGAALADGDPVLAVLRAVGTAHNGRGGGLTGTDRRSQASLWRHTAAAAGCGVRDIGYLEAHGTGTPSGDGVELDAAAEALAGTVPAGWPDGRLRVGSVKANVGHLEAASGLIGLVKTVLVLRHGRIPRIAGLARADPELADRHPHIEIAVRDEPWPRHAGVRRAAVNSFGLGGTLSQVIVEEAPAPRPDRHDPGRPVLVPLSAGSADGLAAQASRLLADLEQEQAPRLPAIAWTLQVARPARGERCLLRVADLAGLRAVLRARAAGEGHPFMLVPGVPGWAELPAAERDVAGAWLEGEPVDWTRVWPDQPPAARAALSGSVFERRSHWFDGAVPEPVHD